MTENAHDSLPLIDADFVLGADTEGQGPANEQLTEAFEQVKARVAAAGLRRQETTAGGRRELWATMPSVAVLHSTAERVLRQRVTTVVGCLERLVRRYPHDARLQRLLDVPPALRRWVLECPEPERLSVDYCRLDLLGDSLGTVRILEFNASSPGGMLTRGVVNRFWRESALGGLLDKFGVTPAPFEKPHWFADWLLDFGHRQGLTAADTQRVGLFHATRGTSGFEFDLMAAQLRDRGRVPVILKPPEMARADDLRLAYFKHVVRDFRDLTPWHAFCSRITTGELTVPNVLAERWVAENKLCLAALSDPRFRDLFTSEQRAALDALVPFSRKLGDGITAAEVIANQDRLVLKAPYSYWGKDVLIGADTDAQAWLAAVHDPSHDGWLVQQRVTTRPVTTNHGTYFRDLVVPVLDGRVIGYGSRMSADRILNVAHGGGSACVFSPNDLAESPEDGRTRDRAAQVQSGVAPAATV